MSCLRLSLPKCALFQCALYLLLAFWLGPGLRADPANEKGGFVAIGKERVDVSSQGPVVEYTVNFSNPGTYYIWLRGNTQPQTTGTEGESGAGTLSIRIDGTDGKATELKMSGSGEGEWTNGSSDSPSGAAISVNSTGSHTIDLWAAGGGVGFDRIVLTNNPNYTPERTDAYWENQNIYQIVTDRFFNGDPSNDNVDGNFDPAGLRSVHGGDFKGIEKKLDYIKGLGATAIWISPIVLNGHGEFHGYSGRDFYQVDPHWGTLADLEHFITAAHARGLLVIDDIVANHASTLVDSGDPGYPKYIHPPGGYHLRFKDPAQTYPYPFELTPEHPTLESLFHNHGRIKNYKDATEVETGMLSSLDDLKTETDYVRKAMIDIYKYWVTEAGFDGFRIDTVKHVDKGFWQAWCPAVRQAAADSGKPNFFMFGEVYDGSDAKCGSYTGTKGGGAYELDSVLHYPLYFKTTKALAKAEGGTKAIVDSYNAIAANYAPEAQMRLVTFLDNHDQPRFLCPSLANGNLARLQTALVFLYTGRGIPSLYYGTEQGFNGPTDPYDREDMFAGQFEQGPSLGDNFNMASPLFRLVARMNNFRRLYPALRTGEQIDQWNTPSAPGLLAYSRRLGGEEILVVLNTGSSGLTLQTRGTIYPDGTKLANLLDPEEEAGTTAKSQFPKINVPGSSAKILIAQSMVQPLDPVVIDITPLHDGTNAAVMPEIRLKFSKPMEPASVESAFSTEPVSSGSFVWAPDHKEVTYKPDAELARKTIYTVRLEDSAKDSETGKKLYAAFESRFTTEE